MSIKEIVKLILEHNNKLEVGKVLEDSRAYYIFLYPKETTCAGIGFMGAVYDKKQNRFLDENAYITVYGSDKEFEMVPESEYGD